MSLCKGEGPRDPILKTFCDFLTKKYDFQLIVFSFPAPQVPSPPTKVSQNLKYFSGDPTRSTVKLASLKMIKSVIIISAVIAFINAEVYFDNLDISDKTLAFQYPI